MGYGILSALSGAKAREVQMEILANNLANLQTTGFKEQHLSFQSELARSENGDEESTGVISNVKEVGTFVDFTPGSLYKTGNNLDFSIQGDGFFAVQTPDGVRYTRNGNFTIDTQGQLMTPNGHLVLSSSGPIQIPQGAKISVSGDGKLSANGQFIADFRIADFQDKKKMTLEGQNYFNAEGLTPQENFNFNMVQGHLENSNVNLVSNMVRMIQVSRSYESLQKTVSQQMEATKQLNQLARMG